MVNARIHQSLQGATLCTLVLALLAVQYSLVGSFVILTWLVPLIFALVVTRLPLRVVVMVVVGGVGGSLVLFGIVTTIWALFYALYGLTTGLLYRSRFPRFFQVLIGAFAFWLLFQGVVYLLLMIVGALGGDSVTWLIDLFQQHYLFLVLPLVLVAMANALVTRRLVSRVFQRLSSEIGATD